MGDNNFAEVNNEKRIDISGFLTQIGRDLRVPMNTVIGSTEMILHENVSHKVRDSVADIRHAAGLLTSLTDDIIDLVMLTSGKLVIEPAEYMGLDLMLDIRKLLENRSAETGIQCDIDIDDSIPYRLFGDEKRLSQMMEKLILNAFEFTKSGKVGFSFKCLPNADSGVYFRIVVSDSGPGVLGEDIVKVLGGKTWDESATDGVQDGSATRVFLARILAELMGGKLTARSVRDTGNTFTLLIPQTAVGICTSKDFEDNAPEGAEYTEGESGKPAFTAESARVLIVTPDTDAGRELCRRIKRYGIMADLTPSGTVAAGLLDIIEYELVITDSDAGDPGILEFEALVRSKAQGADSVVPGLQLVSTGLSKLADAAELERTLHSRLPMGCIRENETTEQIGTGIEALDRLGLNTRLALENFGGDEEEYRNVLRTMCRTSDTKGKMLLYYLEQHDYKNYLIVMHGILGEAKVIGAEWIENKTQELERAAKQGMRDVVERETGLLAETYDKLLSAIRTAIDSEESDVIKGAIDKNDLAALLSQLSTYLSEYMIDEVEELFYSLAQFSYPDEKVMLKLHEAEEKMLTYDYSAVLECVDEILEMLK